MAPHIHGYMAIAATKQWAPPSPLFVRPYKNNTKKHKNPRHGDPRTGQAPKDNSSSDVNRTSNRLIYFLKNLFDHGDPYNHTIKLTWPQRTLPDMDPRNLLRHFLHSDAIKRNLGLKRQQRSQEVLLWLECWNCPKSWLRMHRDVVWLINKSVLLAFFRHDFMGRLEHESAHTYKESKYQKILQYPLLSFQNEVILWMNECRYPIISISDG